MPTVTFEPTHVTLSGELGESVFEVGRRNGVPIQTACVGRATCGLCRVRIVAGEEALSPINDKERQHLGNVYFLTKERLSCQARLEKDIPVVVEVPPLKERRKPEPAKRPG